MWGSQAQRVLECTILEGIGARGLKRCWCTKEYSLGVDFALETVLPPVPPATSNIKVFLQETIGF